MRPTGVPPAASVWDGVSDTGVGSRLGPELGDQAFDHLTDGEVVLRRVRLEPRLGAGTNPAHANLDGSGLSHAGIYPGGPSGRTCLTGAVE